MAQQWGYLTCLQQPCGSVCPLASLLSACTVLRFLSPWDGGCPTRHLSLTHVLMVPHPFFLARLSHCICCLLLWSRFPLKPGSLKQQSFSSHTSCESETWTDLAVPLYFGTGIEAQWLKLLPVTLASGMGAGLCPSFSTSDPLPC